MQNTVDSEVLWWQEGVVYQIYPRSFMDSNDDGVGDLAGIISRLDYLTGIGVDAIWLSPIYPSPMADFGYDVANYTDVDPVFGDLATFDRLVAECHSRNMKVIIDYVPNHTSDEHSWFQESRASRDNPKRDWYIWHDPKPNGDPPNNWQSHFIGDAWQFDAATGQYYLHLFDPKQPDLNWRNPDVRKAMYDVLRFWFDRGVDGFRIDVLPSLIKDKELRDNPPNPKWREGQLAHQKYLSVYTDDQPENHEIVQQMRAVAEEYHQRVLIGETYLPYPQLIRYYGEKMDEAHLPFNFELVIAKEWTAQAVRQIVDTYETSLPSGAWPNWVLGNHDRPRLASRIGAAQARVGQMLLLTLRGTPTCYYGDELGMHDIDIPLELINDPPGKKDPAQSRDRVRTPMQWDASPQAGFTNPTTTPWLPLADDYTTQNVAVERADPSSMLTLFTELTRLRRSLPALAVGAYKTVKARNADVFAYLRQQGEQKVLVVLNFTATPQGVGLPADLGTTATVLCSTHLDLQGKLDLTDLKLRPDEGLVLLLDPR